MIDLSNLTIIIPSYNRQDYVIRSIEYWSNFNAIVHIFDGSKDKINHELLGNCSNVTYHHLPISYAERLGYSINFVQTKYAVLLGDDEFFIPSSLIKCMDILELGEFSSIMGKTITFEYYKDKIFSRNWESPFLADSNNYIIEENDSFDRMMNHMNNYLCSTIYAVTKSEVWIKCIECASIKTPFADTIEFGFELANAYLGKSKIINTLMWLRSYENEEIYSSQLKLDKNVPPRLHEIYYDLNYRKDLSSFFSQMANKLIGGNLDISENEIEKMLYISLGEYIDNYYILADYKKGRKDRMLDFFYRIGLKSAINFILRNFKFNKFDLIQNANYNKEKTGLIYDLKELSKIQNLILEFHNDKMNINKR